MPPIFDGIVHIHAFILKEEQTDEKGLRMEFYPLPPEIIDELVPAIRDFTIMWMMEHGTVDTNSVLINAKKPN